MKKESLQITTVKTLLAVLLFAGMGTIIVGGGYIIGEYNKTQNNNRIIKTVEENQKEELATYCKIDSDCESYFSHNTCEVFCANKDEKNQKILDGLNKTCDPTLWFATRPECKCIDNKCQRAEIEEEIYCTDEQNNRREIGETWSESSTMFKECGKFGNISTNYVLSCDSEKLVVSGGFGVVNRKMPSESFSVGGEGTLGFTWTIDNNKYKTFSGGPGYFFASCDNDKVAIFYAHPVEMGSNDYTYNKRFFDGNSIAEISCSFRKEDTGVISKFEDSKRIYEFKPLENGKEICQKIKERYQELEETVMDISDWQTYRNEEFGFEFRYPLNWDYTERENETIAFGEDIPAQDYPFIIIKRISEKDVTGKMFKKDSLILDIHTWGIGNPEKYTINQKMLSSFKFTEK